MRSRPIEWGRIRAEINTRDNFSGAVADLA